MSNRYSILQDMGMEWDDLALEQADLADKERLRHENRMQDYDDFLKQQKLYRHKQKKSNAPAQ